MAVGRSLGSLAGGAPLITFGAPLPYALVAAVNLLFLPLVMLDAGVRVWQARQSRQIVVLLVLAGLWAMQLGFSQCRRPV